MNQIDQLVILPCPFCNGTPTVLKPSAMEKDEYKIWTRLFPIVRCQSCGATVEGVDNDYGCKSAVDKWNLRHKDAEIERLRDVLRQIGDYAHDHSTGPAVPDALWEVRSMAYETGV